MIITLIMKNLKLIFRDKITILLIILAPILLMFVVGVSFSGETLTNTEVGIVNLEGKNIFDVTGEIRFINYKDPDLNTAFLKCGNALKRGDVEMCLYYKVKRNQANQIQSANVIYLIDDTRLQISAILTNLFDKTIDGITKVISEKSVQSMFSEANDTLTMMKESQDLLNDLSSDIKASKKAVEQLDDFLEITISDYDTSYEELGYIKNKITSQINTVEQSKQNFKESLADFENDIEDLSDTLDSASSSINDISNGLYVYSLIDPTIEDYIDPDDIDDLSDNINSLKSGLNSMNSNINSIESSLNNVDDFTELKDSINENYEKLDGLGEDLKLAQTEIKTVKYKLEQKDTELTNIKNVVDEKIEYFEEMLSRDVSEITEPITTDVKTTHKDFKRIHQLAPSVVVIVVLFIGLLLSNIIVSLEINSKAYFRNLLSPVSQAQFVLALFYTALFIILLQLFFLFVVLKVFFAIPIFANILPLLVVVIHILIVFILIGIFLAYIFESLQVSILVTTFTMLFIFLLSGAMVAIETMPVLISNLVLLNPVVIGEDMIRKIFYYSSINVVDYTKLVVLYVYYAILAVMITVASKRRKNNLF